MTSYKELIAQANELMRQAQEARETERPSAIERCKELIADFDITGFELGLLRVQELRAVPAKKEEKTFAAKLPKRQYPPKYVDPASGKTWSGNGHTPRWIVGNRDDYLIKTEEKPKRVTQNNKG